MFWCWVILSISHLSNTVKTNMHGILLQYTPINTTQVRIKKSLINGFSTFNCTMLNKRNARTSNAWHVKCSILYNTITVIVQCSAVHTCNRSCSVTYINSQDDVTLLCIRNNSTRYLLDQSIDSKGSLTALPYRYISINKSFWSCASKDPRVNIPNSRATAPSTPRAQPLAASDLIHISGLQLSDTTVSSTERKYKVCFSANQPTF